MLDFAQSTTFDRCKGTLGNAQWGDTLMTLLKWSEGPRQLGCAYHKRSVHRLASEDIVIDVFVMPAIREQRPVALTVGVYQNYKPVRPKQKAGFADPGPQPGRLEDVSGMLDRLGVDPQLSAYLADEIDQFLVSHAAPIRAAMKTDT